MNKNIKMFINDLVIDYLGNKLSDHDIQDVLEAFCISNNQDYEQLYKLFLAKKQLISSVMVLE